MVVIYSHEVIEQSVGIDIEEDQVGLEVKLKTNFAASIGTGICVCQFQNIVGRKAYSDREVSPEIVCKRDRDIQADRSLRCTLSRKVGKDEKSQIEISQRIGVIVVEIETAVGG